jgi:hypothetical protein
MEAQHSPPAFSSRMTSLATFKSIAFFGCFHSFIDNRKFYQSQEWNILNSRFPAHAAFINPLKQSQSKVSMYLNSRPNNALGQRLARVQHYSVVGAHDCAIGMRTPA